MWDGMDGVGEAAGVWDTSDRVGWMDRYGIM